jgi:hypothetical protein
VRFITCLTEAIESNYEELSEYLRIIRSHTSYAKQSHDGLVRYGARGILFRTIFEHFNEKGYLSKLGVNKSMQKNGYTQARLVLFFLFYKQPKHFSSFLDSKNTIVTFSDMKRELFRVLNDKNETNQKIAEEEAVKILAEILWDMYDLKQSQTWAHLVTFDALYPDKNNDMLDDDITQNDIENALINGNAGHISITCAGRSYVEFMCSHFEYFSMRFNMAFAENQKSSSDISFSPFKHALFSKATYSTISSQFSDRYLFDDFFEYMLSDFRKCLDKLMEREKSMFRRAGLYRKHDILESPFVFRHPRRDYSRRHLERALQRMITYMDAYRLFLVNDIAQNDETLVLRFNRRMLVYIGNFVRLIDTYLADFSPFSAHAVTNYRQKIDAIISTGYKDKVTQLGLEDVPWT